MEDDQGLLSEAVCDEKVLVDMSLHPTPSEEVDPLTFDIKEEVVDDRFDETTEFYSNIVIKEELDLQNTCDPSWQQTEEFNVTSESSQVEDKQLSGDLWHHTEEGASLHIEVNHSKVVCIHCHISLFNNGCESFLSRMSSCAVCINAQYNHVKPFQHICTSSYVYICDNCRNIYKSKQQVEHHLKHQEYNCENLCDQKDEDDYDYGKLSIESMGDKIRIQELKYQSQDCHIVGSSDENITSRKQLDLKDCKMDIQEENEVPQLDQEREKKFISKHCKKAFTQPSSLEMHSLIHPVVEPYVCKYCKKSFSRSSDLKSHEVIHTGVKPYLCKYCKKVFSRSSNLIAHELIHAGLKPHICKYCKKAFTQSCRLKLHEIIHTGEKSHVCKYCKKAFMWAGDLKKHERTHTGVKPYLCKYCKMAFSRSSDLKSHEMIHTGIKPYVCKSCNKAFTQSSNLKSHEMIHTGVKPHICKYCEKAFTLSSHLKSHEMVHTGVKPHICNYCEKVFACSSNLKSHEKIHTGVKPYVCKYCNKAFIQSGTLKRHERIHTVVKTHI